MQIVIVIVVVFAGVFEVDVSNWSPFMPNGFKSVVTGDTVVFFFLHMWDLMQLLIRLRKPKGHR